MFNLNLEPLLKEITKFTTQQAQIIALLSEIKDHLKHDKSNQT